MNVIDIVADYLMANKYDELCLPEHGYACLLEDLAPCAAISEKCRSGHRVNVSADTPCLCDESGTDHWHIEAKETRMMNSTQQNEVNGGTPLAERIGSGNCSICNWTNVSLLNLGNPGTPRMVCIGCCKRAIEAWVKDHERECS